MKLINRYKNNKFIRNFIIYLTSGGVAKIIPMVILILISKYLSPKEFGLISNFGVIVSFFGALISMKLGKIIQAEYVQKDDHERKIVVSNIIYLMMVLTSAFIFISLFFELIILDLLQLEYKWVVLGILVGLFSTVFDIRTIILRMAEKPKSFAFFQIANAVIIASLNILFIVIFKWSWQGRILATVISAFIMFLVTLFFLHSQGWFPKKFEFVIVKKYFVIGLPLIPMALSPFINGNIAKIILTKEIGLSSNGIYSFGLTITTMVQLLIISYFNTYVPVLYKKLNNNLVQARTILFKDIYRSIPYFLLVFLLVYFLAWVFITFFLDARYQETIQYLPFLFARLFLFSIFSYFNYFLLYLKEIRFISILSISSAILNAILCYILIPSLEIYGAVIALVVMLATKVGVSFYYINSFKLKNA